MNEPNSILASVAETVAADVPLPSGLRALAEETSSRRIARGLSQLANRVEQGAAWDALIKDKSIKLPRHWLHTIRAGANSNQLAALLSELEGQRTNNHKMFRRIILYLSYPVVLMVMSLIVATFLLTQFLPSIIEMNEEFDLSVSLLVRSLMWWATHGWRLLIWIPVSTVIIGVALRVFLSRENWSWLLTTIPIVGPLFWWQGAASFSRTLRLLIRYGIPLPESLEITADSMADGNMASVSRDLARTVRRGGSIVDRLSTTPRPPGSLAAFFRWGLHQDKLDDALQSAAELFDARIDLRCSWLTTVVPPLMFVLAGGFCLGVIVGCYAPLVTMISNLN